MKEKANEDEDYQNRGLEQCNKSGQPDAINSFIPKVYFLCCSLGWQVSFLLLHFLRLLLTWCSTLLLCRLPYFLPLFVYTRFRFHGNVSVVCALRGVVVVVFFSTYLHALFDTKHGRWEKKKQESQQVVSSRYTPPPLDWLLLLATTSTNFVFLIKNSCPVCSFIHSRLSSQCRFVMQCPSSTTSTVGEKKKATVRDKSHDNPVF